MIKNHCLLVQQEWISFLALFEYRILDMILSPHAVRIIPHDIGELPEVAEMAPILLKGPMFHSICFNLTQEYTTTCCYQLGPRPEPDDSLQIMADCKAVSVSSNRGCDNFKLGKTCRSKPKANCLTTAK